MGEHAGLSAVAALGGVAPDVHEEQLDVGGSTIRLMRKGQGRPLVFLHDSLGNIGWLPVYDQLAATHDVIVPDLPGYGRSPIPAWARSPRDLAVLTLQMAARLGLDDYALAGVGLGGWIAAEMATMDPRRLSRLALVGAAGIKPREGEIADQMLRGALRYGLGGFRDAESFRRIFDIAKGEVDDVPDALYDLWDFATEMTARIVWKPWMFSLELPHLLGGITAPTSVIWGAHDALFPLDIAHQYVAAIPDAQLIVADDVGHWVDLEAPEVIVEALTADRPTAKVAR